MREGGQNWENEVCEEELNSGQKKQTLLIFVNCSVYTLDYKRKRERVGERFSIKEEGRGGRFMKRGAYTDKFCNIPTPTFDINSLIALSVSTCSSV